MRKRLGLVLALVLVCAMLMVGVSFAVAPEFETAKKIAMTSVPDENGNCFVGKKVIENGIEMVYMVGYIKGGLIGGSIIAGEQVASVVYDERDGSYSFEVGNLKTGQVMSNKVLTEEQAVSAMRNVLKRLVNTAISY